MNLSRLRVGYTPYNQSFNSPGDRRRFIFYANERQINFEIANPKSLYDIVYLTNGCDLGAWISYKKKNKSTKLIFELIDSYFDQPLTLYTVFKGIIKFLVGRDSKIFLNYKSAILEIIKLSDAVVCSTESQKKDILKLNTNVHVSLDYFSNDITTFKNSYSVDTKIKLVWEGQAVTANNLLLLNNVLGKLKHKVEIYVITDINANLYFNLYKLKTSKILKDFNFKYRFIAWDLKTISKEIANCDLAVIPIFRKNSFAWNKPENKLLFFWEIGIPTLTTDTPAYKRVMDTAGIKFYCSTPEEWLKKIQEFCDSNEKNKQNIVNLSREYLNKYHSKKVILKKWDLIFKSIE